MFDVSTNAFGTTDRERGVSRAPRRTVVADAETVRRYFQETYPILLDGALPTPDGRGQLLRHARRSLVRGWSDPSLLPAEVLRETLDAVAAAPDGLTKAGLTAIGPKHARIWWDRSILDNLDDVLARLDSPRAVLRFYDVTGLEPESGRWNETFDVDVSLGDYGHTAQFAHSDRAYVVDLGYIYADGRFLRLARTNTVFLPREGRGAADAGETARCLLRARNRSEEALLTPDAEAREWVARRPDERGRDIEAELMVHMLYRAFLKEGPRALRRAPRLVRRDAVLLEREYMQRERARERAAQRSVMIAEKLTAPALLVARLDGGRRVVRVAQSLYLPAVSSRMALMGAEERFILFSGAASAMRAGRLADVCAYFAKRNEVTRVDAEVETERTAVVRDMPVNAELTASLFSAPVFAAAENLRETLAGMRTLETPVLNDSVEASRLLASAKLGGRDRRVKDEGGESPERVFGGSEAKRMAKAGVRITRMALTLEGRMRPGARLKVAGKLVHADAEGKFRLECVLSGRKASIPMRAGVSVGGEARSLINVEWEKRGVREKRRVEQD